MSGQPLPIPNTQVIHIDDGRRGVVVQMETKNIARVLWHGDTQSQIVPRMKLQSADVIPFPAPAIPVSVVQPDNEEVAADSAQPNPETLLDWALWAVNRGWYVFPCDADGKEPAGEVVPKGVLDASNDPNVIRGWWTKNPNYNPAIALGPSNLVGYDFDSIAPYADLPATLTVRSGRNLKEGESGGIHMYFRGSCKTRSLFAQPVEPVTERDEITKKGDTVRAHFDALNRKVVNGRVTVGEIRGRGAYLMAPGAVHKSGRRYTIINNAPLAESPEQNVDVVHTSGPAIGSDDQNTIATFVEEAFDKSGINYKPRVAYNKDGFKWLIDCPWEAEHSGGKSLREGGSSSAVFMTAQGKLGYQCQHAHCEEREWKELRDWMEQKADSKLSFANPTVLIGGVPPSASITGLREVVKQQADQQPDPEPAQNPEYDLSREELEAQYAEEWPVIPLKPQPGPEWADDIYYGLSGDIIRKASQYNEAHPAGMLLDLLVSVGSMFGRTCYFNVGSSRHYANEFMARVGDSSFSRKGSGRDEIDRLLKMVDSNWYNNRTISGFGSAEAIIAQLKDAKMQQRFDKKSNSFVNTNVPGVEDKRLCIREGELASIFLLASKAESRADVVLRDGWDSKPLKNIVKGQTTDGISNSAGCQEPHLSISGDTTRSELVKKMPDGADENGFGNRFLFVYVFRRQLCPLGGPEHDWSNEVIKLYEAISFAKKQGCVGLTSSAKTTWVRMYTEIENNHLPGPAGKMTSRAGAHIRRIALMYAMLDLSPKVDVKHLRAAQGLWDYCADSAQYIFNGTTRTQIKLLQWLEKQQQPVNLSNIRDDFYHRNEKAERVKALIADLVRLKHVQQIGDTYQIKR